MKSILSYFIIILTLFFWDCAHLPKDTAAPNFGLTELLMQLPAENKVQRDLIMNALLSLDKQKLTAIGRLLESQDVNMRNRAEYAFHGMAVYVAMHDNKIQRQKYITVLSKILAEELATTSRRFLLEQLQYIPDKKVIDLAKMYLADGALSETSIMVLKSHNSAAAAKALINALDDVSEYQKSVIIVALAEMNYKDAAEAIFNLLPTPNSDLEIAILSALAKLGYQPAEQIIRNFVKQNYEKPLLLFLLGHSLADNGEKTKSVAVFREIFKNQSTLFNNSQRCAALFALTNLLEEKEAFDYLQMAFDDSSKIIRINALKWAESFKSSGYVSTWIDIARTQPAQQQIEIIDFLGNLKSTAAVDYLSEKLTDENQRIQASAIKALSGIPGNALEQHLKTVLKNNLQQELYTATESILLQLRDSLVVQDVISGYDSYSISGKKLIIRVIAQRKLVSFSDLLIKQLQSDNKELITTALDGLSDLAMESTFQDLITLYLRTENRQLQQDYIKALTGSFNAGSHSNFLVDLVDVVPKKEKIKLLKIFAELAGEKLSNKVLQYTSNRDAELSQEAEDVLLKWVDENALAYLINVAQTTTDEKIGMLAIRQTVIILRKHTLTQDEIVAHCAVLFDACSRAEEKRLLVSLLGENKNKSALELLVKKLDDPDIEFNVFLALLSWAENNLNGYDAIQTEDLIINLIQGQISDSLAAQITQYRREKFKVKPPEGFTALFNGWDLSGWKGLVANPLQRAQMTAEELRIAQQKADSIMDASWAVRDGMLCFIGTGYPNICTINDYKDFELYIDWKIEKDGDSGIYLRGTPQVQIWDPSQSTIGSGGLYNNKKNINVPLQKADKPVGEWNTFHIIMQAQRVTVFLNGKKVVDDVILENYWERDKPIYGSGQIELQAHNDPVYFKNIFLKELPAQPPLFSGALFNGQDLDGWQIVNNHSDSWKVKDGILYCEGQGGGWLSTEKVFGDFELQLEFRLPEGGNSGVFIRAPLQGDPAYSGMEIQLLDDYSEKYKDLKEWQYTGSIYGLQAPEMRASKKANAWQKMIITCKGPQINVILNDINIIHSNVINLGYAEKKHPGIKRRRGFIGLQNHNSPVAFRNIILKELP